MAFTSTDCTGVALAPSSVDTVIYHGDCWDGFAAAAVVWAVRGGAATYIPRKYMADYKACDDIIAGLAGKHVLVVDYCFPLDVTRRIIAAAASFLVLDHHISAEVDMAALPLANKVFVRAQSGATLAYNFMHGAAAEVPCFLRYIEDGDLWTKRLPGIEAFRAALSALPWDMAVWDGLIKGGEASVAHLINKNTDRVAFRDERVAAAAAAATPCALLGFPGVRARVVNERNWVSEVGARIVSAADVDVALMWHADMADDGEIQYSASLRSKAGGTDVSTIARAWGGGGHAAAAGFTWKAASPFSTVFYPAGGSPAPTLALLSMFMRQGRDSAETDPYGYFT